MKKVTVIFCLIIGCLQSNCQVSPNLITKKGDVPIFEKKQSPRERLISVIVGTHSDTPAFELILLSADSSRYYPYKTDTTLLILQEDKLIYHYNYRSTIQSISDTTATLQALRSAFRYVLFSLDTTWKKYYDAVEVIRLINDDGTISDPERFLRALKKFNSETTF